MASLNVHRLTLLAQVARHGSITAAARDSGYTPSAISQQLAKLETEAGQPLLERHPRGISLTDAGRALVRRADRITIELAAARADLDELAGLRAGAVRLGSFPTASSSLVPLAIKSFTAAYPAVTVSVRSGLRHELITALEAREVELALLWDYDWERLDEPALEMVQLLEDPTALLVGAGHRLARRVSVRLNELADEHWVTRAGNHPLSAVLRRTTAAMGVEPRIAFEAHDYHEAQAMVAVGVGVALAPRVALTNLRDDVRLLTVKTAPVRRILLTWLHDRRVTPAEDGLRTAIVQAADRLRRSFGTRPTG